MLPHDQRLLQAQYVSNAVQAAMQPIVELITKMNYNLINLTEDVNNIKNKSKEDNEGSGTKCKVGKKRRERPMKQHSLEVVPTDKEVLDYVQNLYVFLDSNHVMCEPTVYGFIRDTR